MSDIIQNAAYEYQKLLNVQYNFIVGYKNKEFHISLNFSKDEFHHLAGLQYIKGIRYIRITRRSEIFNKICKGEINDKYLSKSPQYSDIQQRVVNVNNLEKFLDSNETVFKFRKSANPYSFISADFILKNSINNFATYFCIQKRSDGTYFGKSIFTENLSERDYTRGHTPCTLLYKEKINLKTSEKQILYINPSYDKQRNSQLQQPQTDNIKKMQFNNPSTADILPDVSGAAAMTAPNPFKNVFEQIRDSLINLIKKQDKLAAAVPDIDPEKETDISEIKDSIEKNAVSKEMSALIETREAYAVKNISQGEYKTALKNYMDSLHGKEMWIEATEALHKQLDECPDNIKSLIQYELKNLEKNIEKKFTPKRQQTLDEIKSAAHKQYLKQQNENKSAEKEITTEKSKSER